MTNIRYQGIPVREKGDPMIEAKAAGFFVAPMYYEWKLTSIPHLFMRKSLAAILKEVEQQALAVHRMHFKIWDPWRPRGLQQKLYDQFYNQLKDKHPDWDSGRLRKETGVYVTPGNDPERIPPHATGGTVDLTLCDDDGVDLMMGTDFDHFGPEAHLDYFEVPGRDIRVRDNRRLLSQCLKDAGLNADIDEWWHYDYGNQKWALGLDKPEAFYGEVADCVLEKDGSVRSHFLTA
jgi:zinc D-Ala-D-Ala dipeptidase